MSAVVHLLSGKQIPLIKKDCVGAERYSHDFNASISYLEQETWIENPFDSNKEVKLNGCLISCFCIAVVA
jgi:hypothetical protein